MNSAPTRPLRPEASRPGSRLGLRSRTSRIEPFAEPPDRSQALGFEVPLRAPTNAQRLFAAATGESTRERCGARWPMYEQVANARGLSAALVTPPTRAVGETRVVRAQVPQTVDARRDCSPVSSCP